MKRAVVALCVALSLTAEARTQEPSLDTVLARAARYVSEYHARLSTIVAEEHYRQQVVSTTRSSRNSRQYRELRSDVLLVRSVDGPWLQFRDVFEVDRKPVRDRDQRLYKLFVEAVPDREQIQAIQSESARYNLGPLQRTVNIPIMGMLFFSRDAQAMSEFKRINSGNIKSLATLAAPAHVWAIEFRETETGTLVRGDGGKDIPSHGRAWIDSRSGRILRTEQISIDTAVRAEVNVTYRMEPELDVLVPGEMRERYLMIDRATTITGRAVYSKFRKFTVTTTEKPKP